MSSLFSRGKEQNLLDEFRELLRLAQDCGAITHRTLFIVDEPVGNVLCCGYDTGEWCPQFMRNTGHEFHPQVGQLSRASGRGHDGSDRSSQDQQYSEANSQIAVVEPGYRSLDRAFAMLGDQRPAAVFASIADGLKP